MRKREREELRQINREKERGRDIKRKREAGKGSEDRQKNKQTDIYIEREELRPKHPLTQSQAERSEKERQKERDKARVMIHMTTKP